MTLVLGCPRGMELLGWELTSSVSVPVESYIAGLPTVAWSIADTNPIESHTMANFFMRKFVECLILLLLKSQYCLTLHEL